MAETSDWAEGRFMENIEQISATRNRSPDKTNLLSITADLRLAISSSDMRLRVMVYTHDVSVKSCWRVLLRVLMTADWGFALDSQLLQNLSIPLGVFRLPGLL
jgi:hypothetical protein